MAIGYGVVCPKPESRKRTKGRKDRAEAKVKKSVRAQCVERDGDCIVESAFFSNRGPFGDPYRYDEAGDISGYENCEGPSQWCHAHAKRRSKTRGQAPDVRHTTADSFMGCQKHHDEYDGRRKPRLFLTKLTRHGFDGAVKVRRSAR